MYGEILHNVVNEQVGETSTNQNLNDGNQLPR